MLATFNDVLAGAEMLATNTNHNSCIQNKSVQMRNSVSEQSTMQLAQT